MNGPSGNRCRRLRRVVGSPGPIGRGLRSQDRDRRVGQLTRGRGQVRGLSSREEELDSRREEELDRRREDRHRRRHKVLGGRRVRRLHSEYVLDLCYGCACDFVRRLCLWTV